MMVATVLPLSSSSPALRSALANAAAYRLHRLRGGGVLVEAYEGNDPHLPGVAWRTVGDALDPFDPGLVVVSSSARTVLENARAMMPKASSTPIVAPMRVDHRQHVAITNGRLDDDAVLALGTRLCLALSFICETQIPHAAFSRVMERVTSGFGLRFEADALVNIVGAAVAGVAAIARHEDRDAVVVGNAIATLAGTKFGRDGARKRHVARVRSTMAAADRGREEAATTAAEAVETATTRLASAEQAFDAAVARRVQRYPGAPVETRTPTLDNVLEVTRKLNDATRDVAKAKEASELATRAWEASDGFRAMGATTAIADADWYVDLGIADILATADEPPPGAA